MRVGAWLAWLALAGACERPPGAPAGAPGAPDPAMVGPADSAVASPTDAATASATDAAGPPATPPLVVHFAIQPVAVGAELQASATATLPSDHPVWIQTIDWVAPAGLHHSRLDAPPPDNQTNFYPIMALPVGVASGTVRFPPGYGIRLLAHQPLVASYHFLNTGTAPITGEIVVRLYPLPDSPAPTPISLMGLLSNAIELPAHTETAVEATCPLPAHTIFLHSMMSHTHHLGIGVDAVVVGGAQDGRVLYHTTEWSDAPDLAFDPPIQLDPGASIHFTCHYLNTTDATVRYGGSAEEEMCGVFSQFSPGDGPWTAVVSTAGQPCLAWSN